MKLGRWSVTVLVLAMAAATATACGGNAPGAKSGDDATGESGEGGGEGSAEAAGSGASSAKNVTAPPVGTKALEERFVSLDFELVLSKGDDKTAGGMQSGSWSIREQRSYEALSTKGAAIDKLKIVFGDREAKALLGVEQNAVTAGKTYVLDATKGAIAVTTASGGAASGEERDALSAEYDWVGEPSPLLVWLRGGALKAGEKLEGGAKQARALLGVIPAAEPGKTTVTVTSRGKTDGARPTLGLDVEAKARIVSGETVFDVTFTGPAEVDLKTGWVAKLDLSANAKASGKVKHKKGPLNVSGKATGKLTREMTF